MKAVDAYFPQDNSARACEESVNICLLSEIHACLLPVSKSAVLVSKNEESCKPGATSRTPVLCSGDALLRVPWDACHLSLNSNTRNGDEKINEDLCFNL